MEAISHATHSGLREFGARCLGEFIRYSIKREAGRRASSSQGGGGGGGGSRGSNGRGHGNAADDASESGEKAAAARDSPLAVTNILSRFYGLASHPSAVHRLGYAYALNSPEVCVHCTQSEKQRINATHAHLFSHPPPSPSLSLCRCIERFATIL